MGRRRGRQRWQGGGGGGTFDRISRANVSGGSAMSAGQLAVMDLAQPVHRSDRPAGGPCTPPDWLLTSLRPADELPMVSPRQHPETRREMDVCRPVLQPGRCVSSTGGSLGVRGGEVLMTRVVRRWVGLVPTHKAGIACRHATAKTPNAVVVISG